MPKISSKHQVTLPVEILELSGLRAGDEVTIEGRHGHAEDRHLRFILRTQRIERFAGALRLDRGER